MLLGTKEQWFELSDNFLISGDEEQVKVTGNTMDGEWCVSITPYGIRIEPEWLDEKYSLEIKQFIGENITPLLLARKYEKVDKRKTTLVENPSLCGITPQKEYVFNSSRPELSAPFDGVVSELNQLPMGPDYKISVLSLMTKDQRYVARFYPLSLVSDGVKRGTEVKAGDTLGILEDNFRVSVYTVNTDTDKQITPLSIFGDTAIVVLERFISTLSKGEREGLGITVESLRSEIEELKRLGILADSTENRLKEVDFDESKDFREDTDTDSWEGLIDPFEGF